MTTLNDLVEALADVEHERWSHWMRYQYGLAHFHEDGSVTIPPKLATRWGNLAETPYSDLEEASKQSDRDEVHKTLKALQDAGAQAILMADGTLVPLNGDKPVSDAVVLRPVKVKELLIGERAYVTARKSETDDDGWVRMGADKTWRPGSDSVLVPINTPSEGHDVCAERCGACRDTSIARP